MTDPVDELLEQWRRERPDIDASAMGVIGRISRLSRRVDAELAPTFRKYGIDGGGFDVLATLRRAGAPYSLTPGELTATGLITSSATAQRINRLESAGLISRSPNPEDGRGVLVTLTPEGLRVVDELLPQHVDNEERLLAVLSSEEREGLAVLLAKLDAALVEGEGQAPKRSISSR